MLWEQALIGVPKPETTTATMKAMWKLEQTPTQTRIVPTYCLTASCQLSLLMMLPETLLLTPHSMAAEPTLASGWMTTTTLPTPNLLTGFELENHSTSQ